jgi:hypothetical protein
MQVPFRQGIVHVPATFLQLASGKVSLLVPTNDTVVLNFADGAANYLVTLATPVTNAWGGPFATGTNYWLYFDVDPLTAALTYGATSLQPVAQATAPTAPAINQHWYNTTTSQMMVWTGAGWIHKIRVFAAQLYQGVQFISVSSASPTSFVGTQVGDNTPVASGAIVYDADGFVFKHSNGTFFTTEDSAITGVANSAQVKFGSTVIQATAQTNLAAYQLVRFTSYNTVSVATNYLIDDGAYGLVVSNVVAGQPTQITMEGVITNIGWDWSAYPVNTMLYVDVNGNLTTTKPPTPIPVATIIGPQTILMRPSSLFANYSNDPASPTTQGSVFLSVAPTNTQDPIAVGDNDPRITAVLPHIADTTVHLSPAENTYLDALTTSGHGLAVLKSDGTGTTVSLVAPVSGMTITSPDGNTGNPTFAFTGELAAVDGLTTTGLTARTGAGVWTTRQLAVAANSTNSLVVTNPDGVAGNPTIALTGELLGVESLTTTGISVRTAPGTWTTVALATSAAPGLSITNPDGTTGSPTFTFTGDLAALTGFTATGIPARTGTGTWDVRTITAGGTGIAITNPDGVAGNPTISLAGDAAAVNGLTTTGVAVRGGAGTWFTSAVTGVAGNTVVTNGSGFSAGASAPITVDLATIGTPVTASFVKFTTDAYGRVSATTAVSATDIETALTFTPVNKAGDTMAGPLNMGGLNITNVATPVNSADAANKAYVDGVAQGLDPKNSVRAANAVTDGNQTLSGAATIDGVVLATGDRVLIRNQTDQTTNGIYVVNTAGAWTRATDAIPGTTLTSGAYFFVEEGTTNAGIGWVLTTANPVAGKALVFTQFSGAGQILAGVGVSKTGNTLSVLAGPNGTLSITTNGVDLATLPSSAGTWHQVQVDTFGRVVTGVNPTTIAGYGITDAQPLNSNLTALSSLTTTGIMVETGASTFATRQLVGAANQIAITAGDGTTANPTVAIATNAVLPGTLGVTVPTGTTAQETAASDGTLRYNTDTASMRMHDNGAWKNVGTLRTVSVVQPAAGITVTTTNPTTDSATYTLALAGELLGVQSLSTFGITSRTNTGTWTTITLQGGTNRIAITNPDGVAGNPIIDLAASGVAPSTYRSVTVDTYGRVTAGTNPTTIAGYGLVDAQPLSSNLTALSSYNTNGFVAQTGPNTFAGRTWSVNANSSTNLTITNPDGVAGNPVLALAADLLAITQLNSTGFAVRTGAQTWAQRQIVGAANRVSVTNPAGVAGDVTVDISSSYIGQTSITTLGTVTTGVWNATAVAPQYGGTGLSALGTANQLLGMNAAASAIEYKTLSGTTNQITVTEAAGSITLSTPQNLDTSAHVTFNTVTAKQVASTVQTLTDAASVAVDLSAGTGLVLTATATVGATRALSNPLNMTAGTMVSLRFVQDATGGRALTFGTAYHFASGTAPSFSGQAASVSNMLVFWCDGTNLWEVSRSLAIV